MPDRGASRDDATQPNALWAVLALVWLCSLGTGIGWNGVYFIAQEAHGWSQRHNLTLGVAMGGVYAISAFFAGRLVRMAGVLTRKRCRHGDGGAGDGGVPIRLALVAVTACAAGLGVVPVVIGGSTGVIVFGCGYAAVAGVLWPCLESALSSGRSGAELRRVVGAFNLTWASAVFVSMWGLAPFMAAHPMWSLPALGVVHLASVPLVFRLRTYSVGPIPAAPSTSTATTPTADAVRARRMLLGARVLLMASYMTLAALSPVLPFVMERLAIDVTWKTPLVSVWMASRLGAFVLMQRWMGWHGHWGTAGWSALLAAMGVLGVVFAPSAGVLGGALVVLGFGAGAIYANALSSAMEAAPAQVESGGKHEAMIGVGYALGPALALMALPGGG